MPTLRICRRPRSGLAHPAREEVTDLGAQLRGIAVATPPGEGAHVVGHGLSVASRTRQTVAVSVPTPDLDARRRDRDLETLAGGHVPDVLVVGGGITGCGIALDAASRGLDVALVEAHDLAFGTSRWSSKLVHGGLRYLAHGDVGVAWESAIERSRLMTTIAPHLIRALPHVMPLDSDRRQRALVRTGLRAADLLRASAGTPRRVLPRPRTVSAADAARLVPGLATESIDGATVHWDGQLVDDARLTVSVARTAARLGARIVTQASAIDVTGEGARITTASGQSFDLGARHVVIATGVWTSALDPQTQITASRGSHVLLRPEALGDPRAALTVPVAGERGRYVFALPTLDGPVIAGITDEPEPGGIPDVPEAPDVDIEWILAQLSPALTHPLSRADVVGTYAGLRPLVGTGGDTATADISRRHLVERRPDGHVVVTGGKLTTYRRMAQDAVDALTIPDAGPCVTSRLPLVGAQPWGITAAGIPRRLVERYGSEAPRVMAYATGEPDLLEPVAPGVATLGVEIVHAVKCEGALDVDDVMQRRTRLSLVAEDADRARPRVTEIIESTR